MKRGCLRRDGRPLPVNNLCSPGAPKTLDLLVISDDRMPGRTRDRERRAYEAPCPACQVNLWLEA